MIELDSAICRDLGEASSREWLDTNGIGGYASGTVSGVNTRRYHGLLVAATRPPLGRVVMLSKFIEAVVVDGVRYELSCSQYKGAIQPDGCKYLTRFRLDPFPIWTFDAGGIVIEKSIFMPHGENATAIQWTVIDDAGAKNSTLELRPLLAFRDHHQLRHEDAEFNGEYEISDGRVSMRPQMEMPPLDLMHNAVSIEHQGYWYRDFEYAIEKERGFEHHEDLYQPFSMMFDLTDPAVVTATAGSVSAANVDELRSKEIKRRADLVVRSEVDDPSMWPFVLAADQFLVKRGNGKTVIAGYHWFSDWGRDTMIALRGLTLATNRPDAARSILLEFATHFSEGMLPNRFPDEGHEPEHNTVDATLWFFEAVRASVETTGDLAFVRDELYDKLSESIEWHARGTRYGIRVDVDGLLSAGEPGTQLTWMDAKIGDWVVTPRIGKAVEIQALWYNALCIMAGFAKEFGDAAREKQYRKMAASARKSFRGKFWNADEDCLYDVVTDDGKDASVRPNQIFAVSLFHSMLDPSGARKVVKKVEDELLTPVGLRSLSPNDPSYVPVYIGSPYDRDAAYHQGTVWSWLIGPFIDAYRKTHSQDARADKKIGEMTAGLREHLSEAMIGQVSEIFDAEPPHEPRGCAAQAWSVAELLRIMRS